jgi:hypothetical protein
MVGSRRAQEKTRNATVKEFFQDNAWFREKIEGREVVVGKKKDYLDAIARLHSWRVKDDVLAVRAILPERTKKLLEVQHLILGRDEINREWLESVSNRTNMIPYNVFINRYLEATEDEGYAKLVNIAPISTVKHAFITIDTDGLLGILKDAGLIESLDKTLTSKKHWESVFDVDQLRSAGKGVFTGTIDTDGVMACAHFLRAEKREVTLKDDGAAIKKHTKALREFSESDPNVWS